MKIIMILLLISLLLLTACASKISDVKNPDMVGKRVTVHGTVQNTIKIGQLSGYTLEDDTDTIGVSSESLPKEGTEKTVSGVLIKDTLLGYYIKSDE